MIGFIIGFFIGGMFGFLIAAILAIAGEDGEQWRKRPPRK